jgi:outer membrane protein assembly factor BamA
MNLFNFVIKERVISYHWLTNSCLLLLLGCLYIDDISAQTDFLNDTLVLKKPDFKAYPYVFYTPETKLAFGAGGIFVFYADRTDNLKPSKVTLSGYYSTNKQYYFEMTPEFYFLRNKLFITLPTTYGYYKTKFFGIGDKKVEEGTEYYTSNVFNSTIVLQTPTIIFSSDRTGFLLDINYTQILDKGENLLLLNDSVPGSNGGFCLGLGYDGVWDTRDNIFYPTRGSFQYFKITLYKQSGDYAFYTFELDVRKYFHLSKRGVLAGNFYFNLAGGETPFYKMPALGGKHRMRGYYEGQYRDNAYTMMQFEYRQFFWKRFGFVLFAGAGDVASSILDYDLKKIKPNYGAGLRYLFSQAEKLNLRFDVGFGKKTNGLYFGIEEAF